MKKNKFQYLGSIYEDENGKEVFDVKVGNETLKGLKAAKRNDSKCKSCRHYYGCNQENIFRKYDCLKKSKKLKKTYKRNTSFIVAIWAYFVFSYFEFDLFYKIALLVLSLAGFDIVCTLLEEGVPKIYNGFFYRKLKKMLKAKKKEKEAEEAKAKAEEEARIRDVPGYLGIKKAETIMQTFCEVSGQYDFGSNTFNISCCQDSCEVILKILEKDNSGYYRVADVFELYLPRVCSTIELYKKAVETNTITDEQETLFEEFIESASTYLSKKKNEVIYYNNVDEINLKSSTDILRNSLQEETKK